MIDVYLGVYGKIIFKKNATHNYYTANSTITGTFKNFKIIIFNYLNKNQLHVVSRPQQSRQREPSVKTLRSPLSTEF